MSGANNPFYNHKHSDETKRILSEKHKGLSAGEKNRFYHQDHSGANNGFYGKHHTDESKQKMSEAKSGKYNGINNPFYGKTHSEEAKRKMQHNGDNPKKPACCIETNIIYPSIKEAAEATQS